MMSCQVTKKLARGVVVLLMMCCHLVAASHKVVKNVDDLATAEAKDGQLEIVKSIKKINQDGSYTIGYEADDGSFKIESRDILGNIKGTYGYLDDDGRVKRVSYTTDNVTELISESPSVVQRIPKNGRTIESSTTPSSVRVESSVSSARRTTEPTKKSTTESSTNVVYATSAPSAVAPTPRSLIATTGGSSSVRIQKSEGQISRPEVASSVPPYRRVSFRSPAESESLSPEIQKVRGNLLRRQSSSTSENPVAFDPRKHVASLRQGAGDDASDVYGSSFDSVTSRPLFTTTDRGRIISSTESTTFTPVYYTSTPRDREAVSATEVPDSRSSPRAKLLLLPYDAPPERPPQEPPRYYVSGTRILYHPASAPPAEPSYVVAPMPPPQVPAAPSPYRLFVPRSNSNFVPERDDSLENQVDNIKPPVSTRDFRKILEYLVLRQERLERANVLAEEQRQRDFVDRQHRATHRLVNQRMIVPERTGPVTFTQNQQRPQDNTAEYVVVPRHYVYDDAENSQSSYVHSKRMARLLRQSDHREDNYADEIRDEEFLPPQIREMLLLRMLQLAVNPALPLDESKLTAASSSDRPVKRHGTRNVQVLGEVSDESER